MPIEIASDNNDLYPLYTKIANGEIVDCRSHYRHRITVAEWNSRPDELIDVAAYTYNKEADDYGLDPWRVVDGIDPIIAGDDEGKFDVWFASGRCMEAVSGSYPLYIHEKHVAILKGAK
jgi:hypothetical protein